MDKIKILVVDDESEDAEAGEGLPCRLKGIEVLEAGDGEEAVDMFLPAEGHCADSSGCDDAEDGRLGGCRRRSASIRKVPIIMLTAKGEESDELQGFDLGVDEYISKPFSPKILVARVEAILRRSNGWQPMM